MNSQFSHQSHQVHQVNICNQCKRPNMTKCSNVQKVEHVFHKNMYSVQAPAQSYQSDGDRFSSTRGFDSFLGFRQVVFRILQDFHELQTFKHDPILSIQSSLVQGHRSNFHHIHLNTGFWPGFWPCKGIQQVEQLNLNGDDEHGHRKEFWCFPPWKRFENEIAPRLTAWRAWA